MNGWVAAIGQPVLMVVAAPLLIGWIRLVRARLEGRAGAGIGQPWRDVRKLAGKEPISPADAGWLFAWAPPVLVATSLLIAAIAPLASTTSVAGGSADLIAVVGLLLLGTVALGLAALDTVCVYATALHAGGHGTSALNWTFLLAHANQLDPEVIRLAAGLAVLGFGTKAGLAPMHAWLPDAHSQAPAPVSALMSGVLLSVAFTAILRYKVLTDAVLGPGYMRTLLIAAALASLTVAALLLISQRDYKRMLAYSSIEHMGVAALGAAAGTRLAATAVLLHILGHGLAKAVAFTSAGQILQHTKTSRITGVRGLATTRPALAGVFGLAIAALAGLPPFPLFASELGIARSTAAAGLGWALTAALALLLVIFAALARHTTAMLLGPTPDTGPEATSVTARGAVAPLVLALTAAAVLGTALGPLQPLLRAAASIVGAP